MSYSFGRNYLLNTVGFDRVVDAFERLADGNSVSKSINYPPYNILKVDHSHYSIEVAVAGFLASELDITVEGNKLSISGEASNEAAGEYLHKGIATRDFTHEFTLAETIEVKGAKIANGFLTIQLENVIPEEKKPRKVLIQTPADEQAPLEQAKLVA